VPYDTKIPLRRDKTMAEFGEKLNSLKNKDSVFDWIWR